MSKINTKKVSFSAYLVEMHKPIRINGEDKLEIAFSPKFAWTLLNTIYQLPKAKRKISFSDEWFMLLDELYQDEKYIWGRFKSAEYGTKNNLIHADTLEERDNPKDVREGEENFTHFVIRKSDGFMLLQFHLRLNRAKFVLYIEKLCSDKIKKSIYRLVNVASLIGTDLIEDLQKLDKVKSTIIEIISTVSSDENAFVKRTQKELADIEANYVKMEFKAKYVKEGLGSVIAFVQKYRGQKGVKSVKIVGDQSGAEKTLNVGNYSERYTPEIVVDINNNPQSIDCYAKIKEIAKKRDVATRS